MMVRIETDDFDAAGVEVFRLTGKEAISTLFAFDIHAVSKNELPSYETLLGANLVVVFERGGTVVRRIAGVVSQVDENLDEERALHEVVLRLVPRIHFLQLVTLQEIFQRLSVPDIVLQKLGNADLVDEAQMRLSSSYPDRDFVVQYRETDMAFVSRLCEHLGISFFFEDQAGQCKIVFTDENSGFARNPSFGQLPYEGGGAQVGLYALRAKTQTISAMQVMMDYNYRTPQLDLTAQAEAKHGFGGAVVEYGAHQKTPAQAEELARLRAEELDCRYRVFHGESVLAEVSAGHVYKVVNHPRLSHTDLLVVSVEHDLTQALPGMDLPDVDVGYRNRFAAIPAEQPYRPPRRTPRPRIHGIHHGCVQPRPGQEVGDIAELDEWGRYTVQFLFDFAYTGDRKASKPVRMAQPHVGPNHGMHFPLRPGIEVVMSFIEGDPDRPIILGALHNAKVPSHISQTNPQRNQIRTGTGVQITIQDAL